MILVCTSCFMFFLKLLFKSVSWVLCFCPPLLEHQSPLNLETCSAAVVIWWVTKHPTNHLLVF